MNLQFLNNYSGKLGDGYASSTAQYLNELTSINARLADIEVQIVNPHISQSTVNDLQAEKVRLMARKAAINAWLSLSRERKNKTNPFKFMAAKTNQYIPPLNKLNNQFYPGENIFEMNIAGIPLLLVIGLVGAGVYVLYSNMKKR
jgi:ABC-type phosphate transport system auxiliary subunit